MNIAIYAGTFDPITNGHLDIIQRATQLFDKVIIAVAENPSKNPLFELKQRAELVQQSTAHLSGVEIIAFSGLLVELAQKYKAKCLIRGLRGADDTEYEIQLAQLNQKLAGTLETIFFPPAVEWRYLSSTMVREIFRHQGDVAQFVPECVHHAIKRLKF
ncbi:Phosphopantetheine adenylyltransferase [Bibersteinia trehalosi USDA-ARS-USMARC-188]|uniref:Phosphopantetheine adenylyltransferase n=3 Tax=Bibersteinia trehalosi TaxID=47735 RepID=A0A4V7I8H0_BIBTR|nr:pantetheine-phosphate adenylyltransferase [Bibersteinia trehalosi]AGH38878.1 Phosphopantetheine adenylyltransferase [Bibersteinia trehalosi USDA-ARS-USMARC-192]AHG81323.1 Phosphopantetheine adenylyltransferase [Bibersteinia trehalosi USDA-ARS-USMARC-188]AHG83586.1 Phosphopantetheine adenylyltransferase [Bibersteinia trehalosi USDA-ARS-USMARC-189]OAQ14503.1 phosphopantetheine adenylyltransferase [Bibersteinia trehalosi Y31]